MFINIKKDVENGCKNNIINSNFFLLAIFKSSDKNKNTIKKIKHNALYISNPGKSIKWKKEQSLIKIKYGKKINDFTKVITRM